MGKLDGRTALITGGSSGLALSTARLFAHEGATVVITGRDPDRLDAAVDEIGPSASGVVSDAGDLDDIDRLMQQVRATHGRLDVLFASAGAWVNAPLESLTEQDYRTTFDVNVRGTLFTVQQALPLLRDGASIVLNASLASAKALPGGTVYSASKAAVRSFARTWASELRERRIRVNVVSPGPIDTPAYQQAPAELREQRLAAIRAVELGPAQASVGPCAGARRPEAQLEVAGGPTQRVARPTRDPVRRAARRRGAWQRARPRRRGRWRPPRR